MKLHHRFASVSATVFLFVLSGCSGSGSSIDSRPKVSVSGTVTVDGKPVNVPDLQVVFLPNDGTPPVTLPLESNGTFSGEVIAGANSVIIGASMTADAGHDGGPKVGLSPLFLSPQSPLSADVKDGATFSFEVGKAAGAKAKPRMAGARPTTH